MPCLEDATAEATPDVLATAAPPATVEVTAIVTEVATAAPTVAPTAEPEFITYTVVSGDNLYKISVKFNTTMDRIAAQVTELQKTPRFAEALRNALMEPMPALSPDQTAAFVRDEYERWKPIIKLSGAIAAAPSSMSGKSPKFTFIGWKVSAFASPVMCASKAPIAVARGICGSVWPLR